MVKQQEKQRGNGEAAGRQQRGAGGAEPTGSLRAFSRGTPRTIDARIRGVVLGAYAANILGF